MRPSRTCVVVCFAAAVVIMVFLLMSPSPLVEEDPAFAGGHRHAPGPVHLSVDSDSEKLLLSTLKASQKDADNAAESKQPEALESGLEHSNAVQDLAGTRKAAISVQHISTPRQPSPGKMSGDHQSPSKVVDIAINLVTYMHVLMAHTNRTDAEQQMGEAFASAANKREKEVFFVVQKNLNHPYVKSFHFVVENKTSARERIAEQNFANAEKIVLYENASPITFKDIFEYVSDNFVNKTAMYVSEDTYLGQGYEKLEPAMMRDQKILYALTRMDSPEWDNCQAKMKQSTCNSQYGGSHDAYILHLKEPIPLLVLDEMNYETHRWRIEGRIMWAFQTLLQFCVLDPCKLLAIYHLHCSDLHASAADRQNSDIDSSKYLWLGRYSSRLTC